MQEEHELKPAKFKFSQPSLNELVIKTSWSISSLIGGLALLMVSIMPAILAAASISHIQNFSLDQSIGYIIPLFISVGLALIVILLSLILIREAFPKVITLKSSGEISQKGLYLNERYDMDFAYVQLNTGRKVRRTSSKSRIKYTVFLCGIDKHDGSYQTFKVYHSAKTEKSNHAVVKLVYILSYTLQIPIVETSVIIQPNTFEKYQKHINSKYDAKVAIFPAVMNVSTLDAEPIVKEQIISDYKIYETPESGLPLIEWKRRV